MARQNSYRTKGLAMFQLQLPPEATPNPMPAITIAGMDTVTPLSRLTDGKARLVQNLLLRESAYESRDGTSVLGSPSETSLLGLADVLTSENIVHLARFRTNGVDTIVSGNWVEATGVDIVFSGNTAANLATTQWNEDVLFTAGKTGIFKLVFTSPGTISLIPDSPILVHHLTSFSKRVIASIRGKRIQWSVNGNSDDWTGLGSGYEDLLTDPGTQKAVVPITDDTAMVIRSGSIWQMNPTGNFDAPFAFSQFASGVGSSLPGTVAAIPRGAMFVGNRAVWKVGIDGWEDVGKPIRNLLSQTQSTLRNARAAYDVKWGEYRLILGDMVLRYNIEAKAWTVDRYLFPLHALIYSLYSRSLTIDELTGTINGLEGAIDDLGVGSRGGTFVYAMGGSGRHVVFDDSSRNNEPFRDVNENGELTAGGFRLETSNLPGGTPLHRVGVTDITLEYLADEDFTLTIEYSVDGGTVWNFYSTLTVPASDKPNIVSVARWIERDSVQFAVSTEATPAVRLIGLYSDSHRGGRIQDAR